MVRSSVSLAVATLALALVACHALVPLSPRPAERDTDVGPVADDGGLNEASETEASLPDQALPSCTDPAWWNAAWSRRRPLSFDNSAQAENLIGFPVAVRLDLTTHAASDFLPGGKDVRFVSSTGQPLPFEIESWSETEAIVWVKVPVITAGSDTDPIWIYFTNPSAPSAAAATPVWDPDFVGVWHMQNDPGPGWVQDSSQGANHASNSGLTTADCKTGRIGRGLAFNGSSYLRVPSSATDELAITSPALTLEGWGRLELTSNTYYTVVSRLFGTSWWDAYTLVLRNNDPSGQPSLDLRFQTYPDPAISTQSPIPAKWQHLAGVRDGNELRIYIDGQLAGTLTATSSNISTDKHDVLIGANENHSYVSEHWSGMLDEVRISTVPRSGSWIAATYLNGTGQLVKQGSVESCHP